MPRHALEAILPGLQGLFNGGWLFAGVLGGIIIRKPGAALFVALVAALLSALVGNQWGPLTLVSGAVQGLGAELVLLALPVRELAVSTSRSSPAPSPDSPPRSTTSCSGTPERT